MSKRYITSQSVSQRECSGTLELGLRLNPANQSVNCTLQKIQLYFSCCCLPVLNANYLSS